MNEAFTDRSRPLAIHIDRLAPGGLAPVSEELRRDRSQKGAFRSKVVVDHVEKHHQSAGMGGGIDQRLQLLRPAVGGIRRIEEHTVISPVPPTGKSPTGMISIAVTPSSTKWSSLARAAPKVPSGVKAPICIS